MRRLLVVTLLALAPLAASAKTTAELAAKLSDPKGAQAALEELISKKQEAVPALIGEAMEAKDIEARGWAIAGLAEIGGADAEKTLVKLTDDAKAPMLVRTWAAAGRINMAKSLDEIAALAPLAQTYPAVNRPLTMKVTALASSGKMSAETLLSLAVTNPSLQQILAEPIMNVGIDPLVDVMAHSTNTKNGDLRQQAAAYLGAIAGRQGKAGNELVGDAVAKVYKFDPKATDVPWAGGPLYVPNIGWDKQFATKLTRTLVAWHVWCGEKGREADQKKLHHNLNSYNLAVLVGYQFPGWGTENADWLPIWGKAVGKKETAKILEEQGLENNPKYKKVLDSL